ncbi:hypothetical protein IT774_08400 [Salinimonas marina]|uniref:Lipoprotein n=1 Tax=Salinimonas marina TaxID=2785918 RepID=A0A7S9DUV2_9ALTE|nr:DUF6279 family lipoprotein [Salinimonas marina]QPG04305.1 hypothetical protein IT774_08400 [Salinimonas marina]
MKKWIIVFTLMLVSGCSSKLAYDNIDWLVYWYMDDYVELTDEQEDMFDAHLHRWIDWHRQEQLDLYLKQLQTLNRQVSNKQLNKETIAGHLQQTREHVATLRQKLAPDLAQLAARLNDEQVIYLFAAIEKENREREEDLAETMEESDEERFERLTEEMEDNFEERLGDLTDEQEQVLQTYAPAFHRSDKNWLKYRRDMQSDARRLFANRTNPDDFVQQLTDLINNPDRYRSDEYLQQREENREAYLDMVTQIVQLMTPRQREHVVDEINDLIEDIQDMQQG